MHGISNERAAAEGRPADEVADAIADVLVGVLATGVPVVAYNAAFDLTLLSAELRRHGLPSLRDRLGGARPGAGRSTRTRSTVPSTATAGASATSKRSAGSTASCWTPRTTPRRDALAAVRLACAIAERHPKVAALGPAELHRAPDRVVRASGRRTSRPSCAARATRTRWWTHVAAAGAGGPHGMTAAGDLPAAKYGQRPADLLAVPLRPRGTAGRRLQRGVPPRPGALRQPLGEVRATPATWTRTVVADGEVVGKIAVFGPPDERQVTYWIGRAHWGRTSPRPPSPP